MWAVVPLKSPETAKSRLSPALNPVQRARLFLILARQVLRALTLTPGIERVAVATASEVVSALARSCGVESIRLNSDRGTAHACRSAIEYLKPRQIDRLMLIAGDIPLISAAALTPLITLSSHAPFTAVVPDRRRIGSNVLLCAPPETTAVCFGPGSFAKHVAAARQRGVAMYVVDSDSLSLDIDDIEDLRELQRRLRQNPYAVSDDLRALLAQQEQALAHDSA